MQIINVFLCDQRGIRLYLKIRLGTYVLFLHIINKDHLWYYNLTIISTQNSTNIRIWDKNTSRV